MRRLDGWEPEITTRYVYDRRGRLVRSITTREPEWDEEQQGWMLALALWRASQCPHCGRDLDQCTAPDAEGAFVVPPPSRCHATTALAVARGPYQEAPHPEALLFRAERR